MATTRIKDISKTTTDLASDTYGVFDGATNGTQKMSRDDMYADWAAAYVAAPTTYKLAPLNSGTNKIDATYLPTSGDTPKGEWDANANSPALADGSGTAGDYYDVTTAGTQDLGSGSIAYTVGDVVKYNGSTWYKIDSVANILDGSATAADGRSTLSVNSKDEDAQANALKVTAPALYFNGSSSVVTVADDDKLSFTDGVDDLPFSIGFWLKSGTTQTGSIVSKNNSSTVYEWVVQYTSGPYIRIGIFTNGGSSNYIRGYTASTIPSNEWVHVAFTYDGSADATGINAYISGVVSNGLRDEVGTYTGMSNTGAPVWIGRSSTAGYLAAGNQLRQVCIFNRELTASEVAQLARGNDLGFADEWGGANGGAYTSDFSAGVDTWDATNGTAAGNVDSIGGKNDNLRLTVDATSGVHYLRYTGGSGAFSKGKRYRVDGEFYIPSAQSNVDGVLIQAGGSSPDTLLNAASPSLDSWVTFSAEFKESTASSAVYLYVYALDGGLQTFQDAGSDDVLYVRNIKITEIGTLADFRAEQYDTSTSKLYDLSDNAFVGTGTSVSLTGREQPVYETGTWTPSITFGGGSTGITYNAQSGYYTRIGNIVHVTAEINLSNKGTDTGAAVIGGLPFTSRATSTVTDSIVANYVSSMAGLTSAITARVNAGATTINLYDWGATGTAALDDTNFGNSSQLRFSGTYQI